MGRQKELQSKMSIIIQAYHNRGAQSTRSFASEHGLSVDKLKYWNKKLNTKKSTASAKVDSIDSKSSPDFIPLHIAESSNNMTVSHLEIRLSNGIELKIPI